MQCCHLHSFTPSPQGWVEGGFNGRTNKLVDGCYSFWQGALFSLLQRAPQGVLARLPVCPFVIAGVNANAGA